jgi:hypothetical protein
MGLGVLDCSRDGFIGAAAISSGDFLHRALDECDLIINVGHDTVEKPPFLMVPGCPRKVIHINFSVAAGRVHAAAPGHRRHRQRHLAAQGGHHPARALGLVEGAALPRAHVGDHCARHHGRKVWWQGRFVACGEGTVDF